MTAQLITNQFERAVSERERRKLFIERMERKLVIKKSMLRARQRYILSGWFSPRMETPLYDKTTGI